MRNVFLLSALMAIVALSGVTRADVFEVPLPTGEYYFKQRQPFSLDLGTELAEIRSVRVHAEGSIVAPLAGPYGLEGTRPINGTFAFGLFRDGQQSATSVTSSLAGRATYPDPEPFAEIVPFGQNQSWQFLLDGKADGFVQFVHGDLITGAAGDGRGILSTATLIIDATPIPEPAGLLPLGAATLWALARRRRSVKAGITSGGPLGKTSILSSLLVLIASICGTARAVVYEVPLSVTGDYGTLNGKNFEIDLGFALAAVHSVHVRAEGTIAGPLTGPFGGPWNTPANGMFRFVMFRDEPPHALAEGPRVGRETHPAPEPFAGVASFSDQSWDFLLDGSADGYAQLLIGDPFRLGWTGGHGRLTTATLVIDATPVPEPAFSSLGAFLLLPLLSRRRR